jgi:hypothetical protein
MVQPVYQTSGTFNNLTFSNRQLVERAYGVCGIGRELIAGEMASTALTLLGLVLKELVGNAGPLWTLNKVLVPLVQGQTSYSLGSSTNDVKSAFYRQMNNVTANGVVTASGAGYLFNFTSTSATEVDTVQIPWGTGLVGGAAIASTALIAGGAGYVPGTYVNVPLTGGSGSGATATIVVGASTAVTVTGIQLGGTNYNVGDLLSAAASSLGGTGTGLSLQVATLGAAGSFVIQTSPDGVNWKTVYTPSVFDSTTGNQFYDMTNTQAQSYLQILPTGSGVTLPTSASFAPQLYNTGNDILMYRMNPDDYFNLTNKQFGGRPLQWWMDRQIAPVMDLWPTPNALAAQNVMVVWRYRYLMDAGSLQQTSELPPRWYFAIMYALAQAIAMTEPTVDPARIPVINAEAAQKLKAAWGEERDKSPMKFQPRIGDYTR